MSSEGSALRCLDGCAAKDSCPFDAEKIYVTNEKTGIACGHTEWPVDVLALHPTPETIYDAIKTGPYGRCVYHLSLIHIFSISLFPFRSLPCGTLHT